MSGKLKENEYGCLQDLVLEIERFCKSVEPVINESIRRFCNINSSYEICKERFLYETK